LALNFPGAPMGRILVNTVVWVVVVVACTLVISLGLAQFLNKTFRGRKIVRLAIVIPWACSVVMTTLVFKNALNPDYGLFNRFLTDIGLIDKAIGFTKDPNLALWAAVVVAIFVSRPATTFGTLAGLPSVHGDNIEAADGDAAAARQRYWQIIFPAIRSANAVAALNNIINVGNSLPILQILNETPG